MNRKLLDEAYRARAGMIGALATCVCLYPIRGYNTTSGHDERCRAHAAILAMRAYGAAAAETPPSLASPFSVWRDGALWAGRCTACGAEQRADSVPALAFLMFDQHKHREGT